MHLPWQQHLFCSQGVLVVKKCSQKTCTLSFSLCSILAVGSRSIRPFYNISFPATPSAITQRLYASRAGTQHPAEHYQAVHMLSEGEQQVQLRTLQKVWLTCAGTSQGAQSLQLQQPGDKGAAAGVQMWTLSSSWGEQTRRHAVIGTAVSVTVQSARLADLLSKQAFGQSTANPCTTSIT